jgi:AmmeMemoRadiSam system protein A
MELNLSTACKRDLLRYARETIGHALELNPGPDFKEDCPLLKENYGLFVTLTIGGKLRGCIGYIEGFQPVRQSLGDLALSAAFNDPRFPPLNADEFSEIEVEITILSIPEKIADPGKVTVGRHGLIISRGYAKGLLLPQVPVEHHMNREEFLTATCQKAGLPPDAWKDKDTTIEVFEGYIFSEKELTE